MVLSDAGYWIGLLDPTDPHHSQSYEIASMIERSKIVVPWPCMYEVISTRLTRRSSQLLRFEEFLSKSNILILDDQDYKAIALRQVFTSIRQVGHTQSLVDSVIREILKDSNIRINFLVTYNTKDFADICNVRQILILN